MDTSGYDPKTGRTFTRAESHEITHDGCVLSEDQIRELVPHGVWRLAATTDNRYPTNNSWTKAREPMAPAIGREVLSPSQLSERVLHCEACVNGVIVRGEYEYDPCPNCSELRTLLLKLAGERGNDGN